MAESTWHEIENWFKSKFSKGESAFMTLVKPIAEQVEAKGETVLVNAAISAVAAGAATSGGGAVAMAAALASFERDVIANGLPFIESEGRTLIELALQRVKVTGTQAGTVSPATSA